MDTILGTIQPVLQALPGIKSKRDVYITPDEKLIPSGLRQPSIGLKDGTVRRVELGGGMVEETLQVTCIAMVKLDGDDSLVGEAGVIALVKSIESALDENLLGLPGMESAWSPSETASQLFSTDNRQFLVKKNITFEYERTRQRG
jgi:hypothetical protein